MSTPKRDTYSMRPYPAETIMQSQCCRTKWCLCFLWFPLLCVFLVSVWSSFPFCCVCLPFVSVASQLLPHPPSLFLLISPTRQVLVCFPIPRCVHGTRASLASSSPHAPESSHRLWRAPQLSNSFRALVEELLQEPRFGQTHFTEFGQCWSAFCRCSAHLAQSWPVL